MSKRVLITGSEGFTGRYVTDEFLRAGWEVWGAGLQPKPEQPQYLQIDLLKPESLQPIATTIQPDVVIHLAAMAFVAEDDANRFYQVNLIGTRNLLEVLSAAKKPPECTIVASSANVYGNSTLEVLSEDSPTNPANDYAVSKLAMEYLAKTYMDRLGIVITRPFNYTGVGQNSRFLIPKIVEHFKARAPVIELGKYRCGTRVFRCKGYRCLLFIIGKEAAAERNSQSLLRKSCQPKTMPTDYRECHRTPHLSEK